jgi:hypothetical protein
LTTPNVDGANEGATNDSADDDANGAGGTSSTSSGGANGGSTSASARSGSNGAASSGASSPRGGSSTSGSDGRASSSGSSASGGAAGENGDALAGGSARSGEAGGSDGAGRSGSSPSGSGSAPLVGCDAQGVSFDEIRADEVRSDVRVSVDATATSQKFLLSHARSGSCLFGAFVGSDPAADGPRGLLVVSYGTDAASNEACSTGTDAIPDDLAPGDAVRAAGYLASYAPSGCSTTPSPELMVDAACPLVRSTRRAVPTPFTLSLDDADALALGTDAERVRRFVGGLVRLEHVSATQPSQGNGSVGPYGVIALRETQLEIHNDLEYGDLTLGGPGDVAKSLVFPYPTTFASVTGLAYLDYCTWSLAPRSRCDDLAPPSDNCH